MDRATAIKFIRSRSIARLYCGISVVIGLGNVFDLVSELMNWNVDLTGLLLIAWLPISVLAAILFYFAEAKLPIISPLAYVTFVVGYFLCTPDTNSFKRTLDQVTICDIAFSLTFACLNAWLVYWLRDKPRQ